MGDFADAETRRQEQIEEDNQFVCSEYGNCDDYVLYGECRHTKPYMIVRHFQDADKPSEVIETNLTLTEAQEHCNRKDTHGEGWFDGYEKDGWE